MVQIEKSRVPERRISRRRIVEPARLSRHARGDLTQALYAVHRQIFDGVSPGRFRSNVVEAPAEATHIELYFAADETLLGYCAMHRYRRTIGNRSVIVLRAEAGLLPENRGRGVTYGFGMRRAVVEKLRHPLTPVYYLGTLVHMSSYHLFCKYFPRLFPQADKATSGDLRTIAIELIESFSDPPVSVDDPLVRDVGWVTIETPQERALTGSGDRLDVAFFKRRNPGYPQGHGLVVVVPMTFANLGRAVLRRLRERVLMALGLKTPAL